MSKTTAAVKTIPATPPGIQPPANAPGTPGGPRPPTKLQGRPPKRRRDEMDFLPDALEILERPPSPTARTFTAVIMLAFTAACAWAWFGHVDVVAVAQGRVVPSGRTKTIQPMQTGVVRAIDVEDGQLVKAGQTLIELDPTEAAADRGRIRSDLSAARAEAARLRAALEVANGTPGAAPDGSFVAPAGLSPELARMQSQLLASQVAEQRAKLAALDREQARREADRATVVQTIAKLNATLPLIRERAEALYDLSKRGTSSRFQYLQLQQDLVGQEQELLVQKIKLTEADASIAATAEQRRQTEAEFRRQLYTSLAEAERKAASLEQELAKAEQQVDLLRLTAPVDGYVQQLAVHTVGGVVTTAQPLMVIVPEDSRLEVEAFIPNKDIGFVQTGQVAEVKVEAFSFTKYGLIPGRVASLSGDAVQQQQQADKGTDKSAAKTPEAGSVYAARIALDRDTLDVDGRQTRLQPGMTVTAEIKTGRRRIADYLLSPLSRSAQEAMHER
ncbi:HlyD family type I secretion periplasmic adaptor subunit [Azospirillum sp. YIM B02556]|uniref:Membrane fusion protein (MFP) family protein n=1 Tax=Azospirillum endophyticum TaxID=2800326 RepID=A0ABS1FBP2_9PROT|nr:HlyD family type I secretion periplasmic adaptor subunit [Azospirillum endophyticum]MBK1840820.1 HlyD family type I secretion periplasmic adaptor subunit [Azospirillum endophyticum]